MKTCRIFLASSAELSEDRKEFELQIGRKNKTWAAKGVFLELVVWEDFVDAMSKTRLQDEYHKAISHCDLFVMLFWTKVGMYTEEEFEHAFGQFKATGKPFVYTYFKDAPVDTGSVDEDGLLSLLQFKKKLKALGHFHTAYKNVEGLKLHFVEQLDKLVGNGFIEFPAHDAAGKQSDVSDSFRAELTGDGAIAQGSGAQAASSGAVVIGGNNSGNINTGTQIKSN